MFIPLTEEQVTKHLPGEHDQRDHAPDRASLMRDFLSNVVGPFFFPKGGKHRAPPAVNWWSVFDDQMESRETGGYKNWRKPIEINDKGAYFVPMTADPKGGDGYFFTSSGKRLWGRYGAAGVMVRSRNSDGAPVYLMAKRSASITGGGGTWALPGGAIDKDESPRDGARREMSEEIGDIPPGITYKVVDEDRNEVEDGWAYTTVLAEVSMPFDGEAQDWETEKGGIGWFTEGQIRQMNLHPALADRLDAIFDLWHKKKGGAHAAPRDAGTDDKGRRVALFTGSDGNVYTLTERPGHNKIVASNPGGKSSAGFLTWQPPGEGESSGTIGSVHVQNYAQGNGIATAMLQWARSLVDYPIKHSDNLSEAGAAWAAVVKHLPGLHNQKSHGNRGGMAPWLLDGGGFLNENEWGLHKWAYAHNIDGYTAKYDQWFEQTYKDKYLPWDVPDTQAAPPKGAPKPTEPSTPVDNVDAFVDAVMGGEGKTAAETAVDTADGKVPLPTNLTITDNRVDKAKAPLTVRPEVFPLIYALDGIPEEAHIDLRLETAKKGDPYGLCQHVGEDKFVVKVFVLQLDKVQTEHPEGTYPDDALYVINNSLVHEMRHVAQHYIHPNMDSDYAAEYAKNGYDGNFYEKEAWLWGHYADPTGTKGDTTEYGDKTMTLEPWSKFTDDTTDTKYPGHKVWGFVPPGWKEP